MSVQSYLYYEMRVRWPGCGGEDVYSVHSAPGGITVNRINGGLTLSLTRPLHRPYSTLLFRLRQSGHPATPFGGNAIGDGRSGSAARPFCSQKNTATGGVRTNGRGPAGFGDWPWIGRAGEHTWYWPTIYYHRVNTLCLRHLHTVSRDACAPPGWLMITSAETLELFFFFTIGSFFFNCYYYYYFNDESSTVLIFNLFSMIDIYLYIYIYIMCYSCVYETYKTLNNYLDT